MAVIQYFSDLDLTRNQLKQVRVESLSSHPSNPGEGRIYYNTTDKFIYYWNDSEWINLPRTNLDDTGISTNSTWSSNKINNELLARAIDFDFDPANGLLHLLDGNGNVLATAPLYQLNLTPTIEIDQVEGLQEALDNKADKDVEIIVGEGLTGGGDLSDDVNIGIDFGVDEGQVAKGNDPRFTNAREWIADTVTKAEAEEGTGTTRKAWTVLRVWDAIRAWWGSLDKAGTGDVVLTSVTDELEENKAGKDWVEDNFDNYNNWHLNINGTVVQDVTSEDFVSIEDGNGTTVEYSEGSVKINVTGGDTPVEVERNTLVDNISGNYVLDPEYNRFILTMIGDVNFIIDSPANYKNRQISIILKGNHEYTLPNTFMKRSDSTYYDPEFTNLLEIDFTNGGPTPKGFYGNYILEEIIYPDYSDDYNNDYNI